MLFYFSFMCWDVSSDRFVLFILHGMITESLLLLIKVICYRFFYFVPFSWRSSFFFLFLLYHYPRQTIYGRQRNRQTDRQTVYMFHSCFIAKIIWIEFVCFLNCVPLGFQKAKCYPCIDVECQLILFWPIKWNQPCSLSAYFSF